jgi:hypothetical protein
VGLSGEGVVRLVVLFMLSAFRILIGVVFPVPHISEMAAWGVFSFISAASVALH